MSSNTLAETGESVLLLGATGATGRHVLRELLASNHWNRVVEAGRRVTAADVVKGLEGKEKLVQKTIDFEKLETAGLREEKADVVIIVLGTSKAAAGSEENFIKIDRKVDSEEYVIDAAKVAKTESEQRLLYLSSTGTSATSCFLYPKSKGLTEQGLDALGYKDFIAFRPGLLKDAQREKSRLAETILSTVNDWMPSGVAASTAIPITELAKSIVKVAQLGSWALPAAAAAAIKSPQGLPPYHIIFNKGAVDLAASK